MKQNLAVYLAGLVIILIACNSGDLLTLRVRPTPTRGALAIGPG